MFQRFQTRGGYTEVTGQIPPNFDSSRRPKHWLDPKAKDSISKNVFYERVIAVSDLGIAFPGPDGKPVLEPLMLSKVEAGSVNIPPEGTNIAGANDPECPMPLKPLPAGHELTFQSGAVPGGGVVSVRDTVRFAMEVEGFTAADRALIRAIAAKLGI